MRSDSIFTFDQSSFVYFLHIYIAMSQAQGDIQERIAAARREAESLKEKIRAKKESSADTSCKAIGFR